MKEHGSPRQSNMLLGAVIVGLNPIILGSYFDKFSRTRTRTIHIIYGKKQENKTPICSFFVDKYSHCTWSIWTILIMSNQPSKSYKFRYYLYPRSHNDRRVPIVGIWAGTILGSLALLLFGVSCIRTCFAYIINEWNCVKDLNCYTP